MDQQYAEVNISCVENAVLSEIWNLRPPGGREDDIE